MLQRSQRLREKDVRNVFHLIGEVTELGRNPLRWRLHLLQQLLPLTHSRLGLAGEHFFNSYNPADTYLVGMTELGWAPGEQERFYSHLNAGGMAQDPMHPAVGRLLFRSFTRRRRDFIPDQVWYSSPVTDPLRRECNVDDTIHSRQRLPHRGWAHFISLMSGWGAKPYGVRDRLIASLVHRELGRLWNRIEDNPVSKLPPRLQQTLDMLLSGYGEKEIAKTLNVSALTAHDFCRRLYRQLQVSSRTELLAHPDCRQLLFLPALSPAYYANNRGDDPTVFPL
jgi:DNA-binding CsgD family transcriptional regulator